MPTKLKAKNLAREEKTTESLNMLKWTIIGAIVGVCGYGLFVSPIVNALERVYGLLSTISAQLDDIKEHLIGEQD